MSDKQNIVVQFSNKLSVKELVIAGQEDKIGLNPIVVDDIPVQTIGDAFKRAQNGTKIVVNKNTEVDANCIVRNGNEVTLELNNASIVITGDPRFYVMHGTLNVIGKGTIRETNPTYGVINLINTDESKFATVNVDSGIHLDGLAGVIIGANGVNNTCNVASGAVLDGYYYALYVHGNASSDTNVINCKGNLTGYAAAEEEPLGAYLAGNGKFTFDGCDIKSNTGIEIRAGELNVRNCKITVDTGSKSGMHSAGSGSTSTGVGVAVAQHSTKHKIKVTLENNVIKSTGAAFMEGDPNKTGQATDDTTIYINSGVFYGEEIPIRTLTPDSDCKNFVYGGKFNKEFSKDFIAEGYKSIVNSNGTVDVVEE